MNGWDFISANNNTHRHRIVENEQADGRAQKDDKVWDIIININKKTKNKANNFNHHLL